MNDSNAITNLTLTYEKAQAIVLSAIQEAYTTLEVDTELGTAKATYRTLDIPENTEVNKIPRLYGSGMLVINAPYLLKENTEPVIKYLEAILKMES